METRLRVADNPVQPLLLMFPLGLFAIAVIFDTATLTGAPRLLGTLAYWNIVAGLLGGVLTVGVSSIEIMFTRQIRAVRRRSLGVLLDIGVLVVFTVIALVRLRTHDRGPDSGLLLVEGLALATAGLGTWIGGRLGSATPMYARFGPARVIRSG